MPLSDLYKFILKSTGSRPLPRIEEHLVESGCKDTDPIYQKMGNSESAYSINPSTSEDISTNPDSGSQAPTSPGVSSPDAEMGEGRLTDASDSLSSNGEFWMLIVSSVIEYLKLLKALPV